MTVIRAMSEIDKNDLKGGKLNIIIDLSGVASREDAVMRVGRILKGVESPLIHGRSLDALKDVVSDWMIENIDAPMRVTIINASSLTHINECLLAQIASNIDSAMISAIRYKSGESYHHIDDNIYSNIIVNIFV